MVLSSMIVVDYRESRQISMSSYVKNCVFSFIIKMSWLQQKYGDSVTQAHSIDMITQWIGEEAPRRGKKKEEKARRKRKEGGALFIY